MVDAQSRARARDTASDIRLRDSFSKVAQSHGDQVSALIDALTPCRIRRLTDSGRWSGLAPSESTQERDSLSRSPYLPDPVLGFI